MSKVYILTQDDQYHILSPSIINAVGYFHKLRADDCTVGLVQNPIWLQTTPSWAFLWVINRLDKEEAALAQDFNYIYGPSRQILVKAIKKLSPTQPSENIWKSLVVDTDRIPGQMLGCATSGAGQRAALLRPPLVGCPHKLAGRSLHGLVAPPTS
jgi:hypothetical protein